MLHHVAERGIYHAMARLHGFPGELPGHHGQPVMSAPPRRAGMSGMGAAFIAQINMFGRESRQFLCNPFDGGHAGSTGLKGFTTTLSNTPALT